MRECDITVLFFTGNGHVQYDGLAFHWRDQETEVLSVMCVVLVCQRNPFEQYKIAEAEPGITEKIDAPQQTLQLRNTVN